MFVRLALVTGIPVVALLFAELRAPGARFAYLARDTISRGYRPDIWRSTLEMAADYPLLGSGLGTFSVAFPLYQQGANKFYRYAHNEWLQIFAEGGLLAGLIVILAAVGGLRWAMGARVLPPMAQLWRRGIGASVAAVALFSFVDFPLRIPAVGLLFSILLGVASSHIMTSAPANNKMTVFDPTRRKAGRTPVD
jgi:O-antigen ligase